MKAAPDDGMQRLMFFLENRLAQLRWSREDLAAAGGPAPSTLFKARRRGGGLTERTLARLDFAVGWQPGSAKETLAGGSPDIRISDQVEACSVRVDAAIGHPACSGTAHVARELKNFLLDVAQRLDDFYTDPVPAGKEMANASPS